MYVRIGGIEQWIQFGTAGPERPILLFLHGGPGGTTVSAAEAWRPWEEHFRVVHWDQRGAGRTFERNGEEGCGALSLDRIVRDALEVVEFLQAEWNRRTLLLVGHSWGSAVGVHMLKRRPECFAAFVGTGQLVNGRENELQVYRRHIARATELGARDILQLLEELGPPPHSDWGRLRQVQEWADRTVGGDGDPVEPRPRPHSPDFKPDEVPTLLKGLQFSRTRLLQEIRAIDLPALGLAFSQPMFFFHGTHDPYTPMELAERYCASITAPKKEFVRFEGCHHFIAMNRPADFLRELLTRVRPSL